MYSATHAVFAGPGSGRPAPTLIGVYATAVQAEQVAVGLQQAGHRALIVGPEQPPLTDMLVNGTGLRQVGDAWVVDVAGRSFQLDLQSITKVTRVHWVRESADAMEATLICSDVLEKPLLLVARKADEKTMLVGLYEDISASTTPIVREREGHETALRVLGPEIDALALWVSVVAQLDTQAAVLPTRLSRAKAPHPEALIWPGPWLLTALHLSALAVVCFSLLILSFAAVGPWLELPRPLIFALALNGWGASRLRWAQWLARASRSAPRWPLQESDVGAAPTRAGYLGDAALASVAWLATFGQQPQASMAWGLLLLAPLMFALTGAARHSLKATVY